MTLPDSDAVSRQAFPRERTESCLEGPRRAFEFFGGVPTRISDDNSKIAVAQIVGSRERKVTSDPPPAEGMPLRGLRLKSHFLFAAHFCLVPWRASLRRPPCLRRDA